MCRHNAAPTVQPQVPLSPLASVAPLEPGSWQRRRDVQMAVVAEYESSLMSEQAFANAKGVPVGTLRYWLDRKANLDADPDLIAFLHSPTGLAFLHRLIVAVHFVFGLKGGASPRLICTFLTLAGLDAFVAAGRTTAAQTQQEVLDATCDFEVAQRPQLVAKMKCSLDGATKSISVAADENHHQGVLLLAKEQKSDFILCERYADDRTALTWMDALQEALEGLPVVIEQLTVDGARALATLATLLDAHLSPDLMHILQPTVRALFKAAAAKIKVAQTEVDKAEARLATHRRTAPLHASVWPQRQAILMAQGRLRKAKAASDAIREAVTAFSDAYHPVDLASTQWQAPNTVGRRLRQAIATIRGQIAHLQLSKCCESALVKTEKHIESMVGTLEWVERRRGELLEVLPEEVKAAVEEGMRGAYLERAAGKARNAAERRAIETVGAPLRERWKSWHKEQPEAQRARLAVTVEKATYLFERSSSNVEGRNGQLALHHHGLHKINSSRLQVLTIFHNYDTRRSDGTTPAQRFFGHPHDDLFEFVLNHVDLPAWPARKRIAA